MSVDQIGTHCARCGVKIQQSTADETAGLCKPCVSILTQASHSLPSDLLVRASYHPGFAEDLTSWETVIRLNGLLVQNVRWSKPPYDSKSSEAMEAMLTSEMLQKLSCLLQSIDLDGVETLKEHFCITDAEHVHLLAPGLGIDVGIAPITSAYFATKEEMPEMALTGLATFKAAWNLIDSLSPYSVVRHSRGKT